MSDFQTLHPKAAAGTPGGIGGQFVPNDAVRQEAGQIDLGNPSARGRHDEPLDWDEADRHEASERIGEQVQQAVQEGLLHKTRPMNGGMGSMGRFESDEILAGRTASGDRVYVKMRMEHVDKPSRTTNLGESSQHWDLSYTHSIIEKGRREIISSGAGIPDVKISGRAGDDYKKMKALADQWHLSGMNSGTVNQREQQDRIIAEASPLDTTNRLLDEVEPDRGYRYGTEWLSKDVPPEVVEDSLDLLRSMKKSAK